MINVNGQEYSWGDIIVYIAGQPVFRFIEITYTEKQNTEELRGAGNKPLAIQCGAISYSGALGVLQSELEALDRTARTKGHRGIVGMSVDIVVQYMKDGIVTVDKIVAATFEEKTKGQKVGDLKSEHTLPFKALDIQYGLAG